LELVILALLLGAAALSGLSGSGGEGSDGQGSANNGLAGDDSLIGGDAPEVMFGYGGNDVISGRLGNDLLVGGLGDDRLTGGGGDDFVIGGAGTDTLLGEDGADTLIGGGGDDLLRGGDGDDNLHAIAGSNTLLGGNGNDSLNGLDIPRAILDAERAEFERFVRDIRGTPRGAALTAPQWAELGENLVSSGDPGADWLVGGGGADTVLGDSGDTLTGGLGRDSFHILFTGESAFQPAIITDFAPDQDGPITIHIPNTSAPSASIAVVERGEDAVVLIEDREVLILRNIGAPSLGPQTVLVSRVDLAEVYASSLG